MTKIAIIIGSTREGRVSDNLGNWVAKQASAKVEVETLDLRDYPMPFYNEAISPRYNPERQATAEIQKWLDKVAEFDGYIVITPEYNRATTAVLKNAIDMLAYEMENKPVALVGHGTSGAGQAVANLRMAFPGVGAVTIPQALFFTDKVGEAIDEDGLLKAELVENPYGPQAALSGLIESLAKYADALKAVQA